MHRLRDDGAGSVLVSRADEPGPALPDDTAYRVELPRVRAADPRGAGDSMTAVAALVERVTLAPLKMGS